ncbi:hypothetical protein BROC_00563 [Candidatus Brocadiaceae bacterium]|nr:hypothetical protein BROC_00563 [Candidatus Brocadiaceae bacterium]
MITKMIRKISFILFGVIVLGFSFSALTAQQSVFQLEIAEGGGYTGSVRGYTIGSDGKVTHWQKLGKDESVLSVTSLPVTEVQQLADLLSSKDMPGDGYSMSGNITRIITLTNNDGTKSWTWCPYMSSVSPQAKSLNDIYRKILLSIVTD